MFDTKLPERFYLFFVCKFYIIAEAEEEEKYVGEAFRATLGLTFLRRLGQDIMERVETGHASL